MRRIGKILAFVVVAQVALWAVGRIAESKTPQDIDPESENFSLAAFVGGKKFVSRAARLHSGSATTVFGGTDIDLTGAELDPSGATLLLKTRFGGAKVLVPDTWHVGVEGEARNGENEVRVADPESLPEDAPRLTVTLDTRFGGALITT